MPSRGNLWRRRAELALRIASLALLASMIWAIITPRRVARPAVRLPNTGTLATALAEWSRAPFDSLYVAVDTSPDRTSRAWLAALRRAGTHVAWSGDSLPPVALELEPVNAPRGGMRAMVAAPAGSLVTLADAAGPLDRARARGVGVTFTLPAAVGSVRAGVGPHRAGASLRDSLVPRAVLVLARAGWEAKFLVAALEEDGWRAEARLKVAPDLDVTQGPAAALDTARYSAVVVLDSAAPADPAAIARFVTRGGGLVLAATAPRRGVLASLAPASLGERVRPATVAFAAAEPRRALGFVGLADPKPGTIALETRDGVIAAAARRVGAGRVVQVGYDETWRWRFAEVDGSLGAHRAWWSGVVAAAALRSPVPIDGADGGDAAPLAELTAALGAPSAPAHGAQRADGPGSGPRPWTLGALLLTLLAEWASRRLRGAR